MKFSTQEEYGLRCLLQIARAPSQTRTIPEISESEGLGQAHVAKLLMILRRAEIINSTRGQAGGYALARPANEIAIADVLAALGGKLYDDEFCSKHATTLEICTRSEDCAVRSLWQLIQNSVDIALRGMSLQDLIAPGNANVSFLAEPPAHLRGRIGVS